jgi:MFS superfamily sulfate permease-like transporter
MLQVDYDEAIFLWRVDKKDFLLWLAACFFTLFLGIEVGVLIGVRYPTRILYEVSVCVRRPCV